MRGVSMIYPCAELKSISNTEPSRLAELEEARDLLIRVSLVQGYCIATFKFGAVSFPPEMEEQLSSLVGRKCAILRIDGRFLVRDLEAEGRGHA